MTRTATPFFNELSGLHYNHLVGLLAAGVLSDAEIADHLDCTEDYVAAVKAALAATVASQIAIDEAEAMVARAQQTRRGLAIDTSDYDDPAIPYILSTTTAAGRRTLEVNGCNITIDGTAEAISPDDLDLNTAASWDTTTGTDYTVAATRAGVDFYLYATADGYLLSAAADAPDGYTTSDSHKVGGFTCVKTTIGTGVPTSEFSGFLAGDILPGTIWDINPATVPA